MSFNIEKSFKPLRSYKQRIQEIHSIVKGHWNVVENVYIYRVIIFFKFSGVNNFTGKKKKIKRS